MDTLNTNPQSHPNPTYSRCSRTVGDGARQLVILSLLVEVITLNTPPILPQSHLLQMLSQTIIKAWGCQSLCLLVEVITLNTNP